MKRFAVLLLGGCAPKEPQQSRYQATFLELFDTVTTIVGYAPSEEAFRETSEAIHHALASYHPLFDIYNPYPGVVNLKTLNQSAGIAPVEVDGKIMELLKFCREVYNATAGKVNIAMGSVLQLWHEAREDGIADPANAKLPEEAALTEAARHTDLSQLILDEEAGTVFYADPEMRLDVGAIAKGSGMIHPNMGTMLCFITTDCAISPEMIREALVDTAHVSFNRISVDGDTSTNDTCLVLANGLAGNETITGEGEDYAAFLEALKALCVRLARMMAKDGEGARHLITCTVSGAKDEESAQTIAKSVISSTLTKAAIFGCDANWGRVLCAMGYSGEEFDPDKVDVAFASAAGEIPVCRQGRGLDFDEDLAKRILTEDEVEIRVRMGEGDAACTCWGCDITYDYIKINGDYRT